MKGKCRICQRVREVDRYVKAVGEVHHGFATGHIWECKNIEDCDRVATDKLSRMDTTGVVHARIESAIKRGRLEKYLTLI